MNRWPRPKRSLQAGGIDALLDPPAPSKLHDRMLIADPCAHIQGQKGSLLRRAKYFVMRNSADLSENKTGANRTVLHRLILEEANI